MLSVTEKLGKKLVAIADKATALYWPLLDEQLRLAKIPDEKLTHSDKVDIEFLVEVLPHLRRFLWDR